jgi:hypothetical protein
VTNLNRRDLRLLLVVNGCVAGAAGATTLVLLLIAPLGLAAVLTLTVLVSLVCLAGGVAGDLVLWRLLRSGGNSGDGSLPIGRVVAGEGLPLAGRAGTPSLTERRGR